LGQFGKKATKNEVPNDVLNGKRIYLQGRREHPSIGVRKKGEGKKRGGERIGKETKGGQE